MGVVVCTVEAHPTEDCATVLALVAADSRAAAVMLLRRAGFQGRKRGLRAPEADDRLAAVSQPGVVLWRDLNSDPPYDYRRL